MFVEFIMPGALCSLRASAQSVDSLAKSGVERARASGFPTRAGMARRDSDRGGRRDGSAERMAGARRGVVS